MTLVLLLSCLVGLSAAQDSVVRSCRELVAVYRAERRFFVKDCAEERFHLYWRVENRLSWVGGRAACGRIPGADLASVHDFGEREQVDSLGLDVANSSAFPALGAYLGLRRIANDCRRGFGWSDGSPFDYANWHSGEPNCLGRVETCAVVSALSFPAPQQGAAVSPVAVGWNDVYCELPLKALCRLPLYSLPAQRLQPLTLNSTDAESGVAKAVDAAVQTIVDESVARLLDPEEKEKAHAEPKVPKLF